MGNRLSTMYFIFGFLSFSLLIPIVFNTSINAYTTQDFTSGFSDLKARADKGDPISQFNLGMNYYSGKGMPMNRIAGCDWFEKAAQQDLGSAEYWMSYCYQSGLGRPKDMTKSLYWLRKGADRRNTDAESTLADWYTWGQGVPQDYDQAAAWYRKAAAQGSPVAQQRLDGLLAKKANLNKDQELAKSGDVSAQTRLAFALFSGSGVQQNKPEAIHLFLESARKGDPAAQSMMGQLSEEGTAYPKNMKEAFSWYLKAANQGNAYACYKVGQFYSDGTGTTRNYTQAFRWFERGKFKTMMGECYEEGKGVSKNLPKAVQLYTEAAADPHDKEAAAHLGVLYLLGKGVKQDYSQGVKLLFIGSGYSTGAQWCAMAISPEKSKRVFIALARTADQGIKNADYLLSLACGRSFIASTKTYQKPIPGCAEASAELDRKAIHGSAKDKLLLSKMYRFGWIVLRDDAKANMWESAAGGARPIALTGGNMNEDVEYRAFVMQQLRSREAPTEQDVPGLLRMLADKSKFVQYVAAGKFQSLQAPEDAGPLLYTILDRSLGQRYQTTDYHGRRSAGMALAHMGPKGLPWLTKALKTSDLPGQEEAAGALGNMGHAADSAIPALQEWGKQGTEQANLSASMIEAIRTNGQTLHD